MNKMLLFALTLLLLTFGMFSFRKKEQQVFRPYEKLSEYGLFSGEMHKHIPAEGVVPYDLNTPLFSDYAHKIRFVKLPKGKKAVFSEKEAFDFPEGTILSKTFYYPEDFRKPQKKWRIIETRILYKTDTGWETFPYVWNSDQTEAYYDIAGSITPVQWTDKSGKKQSINYIVPNKNQCKQCHEYNGNAVPIGTTARSLNKNVAFSENENQLRHWEKVGILDKLPASVENITRNADWNNPVNASVNDRARAYLDINCGHCHRMGGQAATSGLFLSTEETDSTRLGINKTPVAAGRASAGMLYSIHPGHPEKSIMLYRMQSLDPGIMMPEMGRRTVDKEGVELLKTWISGL